MGLALFARFSPVDSPIARAAGPPPDYACRSCHAGQTDTLTLPSGQTLKLGVDPAALSQSVHGSNANPPVYCTDCHQDRARYQYPHRPNPAQTRQEFAADVAQNCRDCHPPIEHHNPGHLAAAGNPNLPTCTDCHTGGHAIAPAAALAADRLTFCLTCHQTYPDPQIDAVHREVVANMQPGQTCEICHTGRPVYPADTLCKTCHSLLQREMTLSSGETISLHVQADAVDGSVHGEHQIRDHHYTALLCTDCHRQQRLSGFPHDPVTPPDTRRFSIEMSNLCRECHEDIFYRQQDSIHAAALAAGKIEAATCVDCHGSHQIQIPNQPRERISLTCAQCHAAINEEYANSVHGAALLGEHNPDVPVCIDCHGVHDIEDPTTALFRVRSPRLCAGCHANESLMRLYGLSTDVFNTYVADFHGTTVELFEKQSPDQETNKAVCYDCHGVHNILPTTDENARVIKENLLETCRQCHPDANANFPNAWTSHYRPSPEHNPLVYYVKLFYAIFIPTVVGTFLLFIALDLYHRLRVRLQRKGARFVSRSQNLYRRFDVWQRLEHALLFISFTVLAVTGLPQKYADSLWGDAIIGLLGGIERTRVIHHGAAIVLMLETIYHLEMIVYKMFVLKVDLTMLPGWSDVKHALQTVAHNIGLIASAPRMGRYTFAEKAEYWAVVWGTVIMVITGFMLWNPIATARLLPGQFIPAAKAAHGGEALLAVLSILTWHLYNVHLKTFNKSMFTGRLSRHEMEAEHPLELAALEAKQPPAPVPAGVLARRRRIFIPLAMALAAMLLAGLYLFVTFEETAITTVPRQKIEIFVPATPTP